ncbi:MAG: hypothetical protein V3U24_07005 [Candidatus Neomarinimicrobiota bacterium]
MKIDYARRFSSFSDQALYQSLDERLRLYVREMGFRYQLTFQELRQMTEISVDLHMWDEEPIHVPGRPSKEEMLQTVKDRWLALREEETRYPSKPSARPFSPESKKKTLAVNQGNNGVFGMCPVASEKTVCCNLHTIDTVQGCGFGCSYCSIQTFYDPGSIAVDNNLSEKLANISLNPERNYHICSGQSSDSLLLGNQNGILDAQFEFARMNPNVLLELKTKSKNVRYLIEADVPPNVFVSWSLNPQLIIDNEEHRTASQEQRLDAARRVADRGIRVAFHFHPMIYYRGWKEDYSRLIQNVLSLFSPEEVVMVSFGTLTFIKSAIKNLRLTGLPSKVLQIPMEETAGKYSYSIGTKEEMFRTAWDEFRPWQDRVFFYLCMESRELWESVFGFCYDSNEEFEQAMLQDLAHKLRINGQPHTLS